MVRGTTTGSRSIRSVPAINARELIGELLSNHAGECRSGLSSTRYASRVAKRFYSSKDAFQSSSSRISTSVVLRSRRGNHALVQRNQFVARSVPSAFRLRILHGNPGNRERLYPSGSALATRPPICNSVKPSFHSTAVCSESGAVLRWPQPPATKTSVSGW